MGRLPWQAGDIGINAMKRSTTFTTTATTNLVVVAVVLPIMGDMTPC